MFYDYLKILRIGHWPKQIFLIPGFIYAIYLMNDAGLELDLIYISKNVLICIIVTNLTSSANYCINEYLDSRYDKYHPLKKIDHLYKIKLIQSFYLLFTFFYYQFVFTHHT